MLGANEVRNLKCLALPSMGMEDAPVISNMSSIGGKNLITLYVPYICHGRTRKDTDTF